MTHIGGFVGFCNLKKGKRTEDLPDLSNEISFLPADSRVVDLFGVSRKQVV